MGKDKPKYFNVLCTITLANQGIRWDFCEQSQFSLHLLDNFPFILNF